MNPLSGIPHSVLDLSPVPEGTAAAEAFRRTLDLAERAEALGARRYWIAEHHSMPGIGSAATAVLLGQVAARTSIIRVGSGGIMLPNHAPLVIAEQFGTLESLFPGRIDLGLGRAPGTDSPTMRALRRDLKHTGHDFPELLEELRGYFQAAPDTRDSPGRQVLAVPGAGLTIPIWLLGSGGFSAELAGSLGLPFASAGHFSPDNLLPGLALYRQSFRPSETLTKPQAMVCINVFAADTDTEAWRLATSHWQMHLALGRGRPIKLPPPLASGDELRAMENSPAAGSFLRGSIIGSPESVRRGLEHLMETTAADELMVHSMVHDHAARLRSHEITAALFS